VDGQSHVWIIAINLQHRYSVGLAELQHYAGWKANTQHWMLELER
jgi:hypothetical protein